MAAIRGLNNVEQSLLSNYSSESSNNSLKFIIPKLKHCLLLSKAGKKASFSPLG